jgi:hypothetical protein
MKITISEGISSLKLLRDRHEELVALRNGNSVRETRFYGANADKQRDVVPVYDMKALDVLVAQVAREIRRLDIAIKAANAVTQLDYEWDDSVLGQIS